MLLGPTPYTTPRSTASLQYEQLPRVIGHTGFNPFLIFDHSPDIHKRLPYSCKPPALFLQCNPIFWSPYNPDLKPIVDIWHQIKDYLDDYYGHNVSQNELKKAILAARDAIPEITFEP